MSKSKSKTSSARWIVPAAILGLVTIRELRKPAAERTWHGRIGGLLPYDLRPPSVGRFRRSWWDPDNPRLLTSQVFGVGWSINLGRVARLVRLA